MQPFAKAVGFGDDFVNAGKNEARIATPVDDASTESLFTRV